MTYWVSRILNIMQVLLLNGWCCHSGRRNKSLQQLRTVGKRAPCVTTLPTLRPVVILLFCWRQPASSVAWWRLSIKCQTIAPTQLIKAADKQPFMLTSAHVQGQLRPPPEAHVCSCGRKPEEPEQTHTGTRGIRYLRTEKPLAPSVAQ